MEDFASWAAVTIPGFASERIALEREILTGSRIERANYDNYNNAPPEDLIWQGSAGLPGLGSCDSAWGQLQQYRYNWQLASVVDRIGMDVASADWYIEEKRGGEWVEAEDDHPLAVFLDEPWVSFVGGSFRDILDFCQRSIDVCSDAFCLGGFDQGWFGRLTELVPIPAHAVAIIPIFNPVYSRWEYWFKISIAGREVPDLVPQQCMFWHRRMSLDMPLERGWGRIQAIAPELNNYEAAMRFNNQFFRQGAAPDMIVSVMDADTSDSDLKKMKANWQGEYSGLVAAAKTMFVKSDLKVVQSRASQRDMQFTEGMDRSGAAICRYYGVPLSVMGWGSGSTQQANEIDEHRYQKRTLLPRVKHLGTNLNRQIIKPYFSKGKFRPCRLAWRNVVEKTQEQNLEENVQSFVAGAIDRDQYLVGLGRRPVGGVLGKQYLVPRNAIAVSEDLPYGPTETESGQADLPPGAIGAGTDDNGQAADGTDQGPNVAGGTQPNLAKKGNQSFKQTRPGKIGTSTPKPGGAGRARDNDEEEVRR